MYITLAWAAAPCRKALTKSTSPPIYPCLSPRPRINGSRRCLSSHTASSNLKLSILASTSSAVQQPRHRLFLAGVNPFLPPHVRNATTPTFQEVPVHDWISSVSGRGAGASRMTSLGGTGSSISQDDLDITHIAAGLGHFMIAYRDRRSGEGKIFAIGRNESGQLGLGYNSQEPTRGLVEGFEGDHIEDIKCGITSSYIQVKQGDRSVVYVCGNQHRGRLGIPAPDTYGTPSQAFLSTATLLDLPGQSVKQIACGYEHLLVLTEQGLLLGTGINTDGQLGTCDDLDRHVLSPVRLPEDLAGEIIESISCGADTSSFLTRSGQLYTFGNSEYAQAFHGEKIDRIMQPKRVDNLTLKGAKAHSFITSGSSSILLDDQGRVHSAGYGAIGQTEGTLSALIPANVESLTRVESIYGGYGAAVAVDGQGDLYSWGVNVAGRLGTTLTSHVHAPCKVQIPFLDVHRQTKSKLSNIIMGGRTSMLHCVVHNN